MRARAIREITAQHYEPGRQDRCRKWVWRKYIRPVYGMCYVTYLKYLNTPLDENEKKDGQLTLF